MYVRVFLCSVFSVSRGLAMEWWSPSRESYQSPFWIGTGPRGPYPWNVQQQKIIS